MPDLSRIVDTSARGHRRAAENAAASFIVRLMEQFWSPLTHALEGPYGGNLDNRLRVTFEVLGEIRKRVGRLIVGGYTADEGLPVALPARTGWSSRGGSRTATWWIS